MGWFQGKGSYEVLPSWSRAKRVSMKWRSSKLRKVGLHDMVVIERSEVLVAVRTGFMP